MPLPVEVVTPTVRAPALNAFLTALRAGHPDPDDL